LSQVSNAPASESHLVIFGEDWGRHPSTAQYLAQQLLGQHTVTWINSIGLREPSLSVADLGRVVGKLKRALPGTGNPAGSDNSAEAAEPEAPVTVTGTGTATVTDPHHLVSPWVIPLHRHAHIRSINQRLFSRQVSRLAHLQGVQPRVMTANPASYYLMDALNPVSSLYYCADKYAQIAGLNPELVDRFERQLLERVDTVVATSLPLVDDLAKFHNNVHYLPHGVDFDRFNSTIDQEFCGEAPEKAFAEPTVGFIGLLGEHIDFELIAATASALPNVRFLFVGPVEQGITLPHGDNLEYAGAVPQAKLPGRMAQMDICTLPYAMTERNHYANPTKVREYLAAGRPVVATRQPGLHGIEGEVSITENAPDYIAAIKQQLAALNDTPSDARAAWRREIAAPMASETWAARASTLSDWL